MSWLLNLYETYVANLDRVGTIEIKHNEQEYTLLPVSHTTQNAHIEVLVTEDGEFHSATVVDKNQASTLIPCTEDSASRAGDKNAPYPLHDKLSYVAGDYIAYGGEAKRREHYSKYIENLHQWASSPYATAKLMSIFRYVSKGRLIEDLVKEKILHVDGDHLLDKWNGDSNKKPQIFSVIAGEQSSAFVRFNVYSPESILTDVWKDPEMYQSFIRFYNQQLGDEDLCFVTGERLPATDKHANKIRNAADKAKLISANDNSGFTFRGRFRTDREAASISYEVSQKAHNALKWLIQRQGKVIDQRVFLVWTNHNEDIPEPMEDTFSLNPTPIEPEKKISFTNDQYASQVAKAIEGYRNRLNEYSDSKVNILVLDSATTGRMAVLYYRSMDKAYYLDRLVDWHTNCAWLHRYRKNEQGEYIQFYGAPATKEIAFAAYGPRTGDKIVKGLMERMLPCIMDGRDIPLDILNCTIQRASNPVSMEKWDWEKTLSIACALINKKEKEGYSVGLDSSNNHRDYLFGRLLAVADVLERRALGEETRATNAIRYMNAFARHPERTWSTIQASLLPYQARLGSAATYWTKIIDEVASRIPVDQFNNRPLSGLYLLGFYSQRHELYQKHEKNNVSEKAANYEER